MSAEAPRGIFWRTLVGVFQRQRAKEATQIRSYSRLPTVSSYINLYSDSQIEVANINEFAYPIVEFIRTTQPDFVVVNSRTARLFGLCVFMLHRNLYQEPFPTRNHNISFANLSDLSNIPLEDRRKYLQPHIEKMTETVERPRVLILDDQVKDEAVKSLRDLVGTLSGGRVELLFGAAHGPGGDISGQPDHEGVQRWQYNPLANGVRHDGINIERVKGKFKYGLTTDLSLATVLFARDIKDKLRK
ncbi:MAG: hypothetical protein HY344_01485 [Candidatus Levybacteria bacterium]|nr:hypothetical protein [Candidatus Levybacteria bacterium]